MIRDITIGQYYAEDSIIHRLDSRIKIIGSFIYIFSLFLVKDFYVYGLVAFLLAILIKTSKVPPHFMFKGLRSIFVIILFTVFIHLFMTPGEVLFSVWALKVTVEGIIMAVMMATRLILLIVGSSMLTLTTSPIELTDGIETLLKPYKRIGIPAHEIAMMMSIAIRFIPTLLEETDKIIKAQQARGADFETGSLFKRAKSLLPILIPLFISAFRRADDLAIAMEARCYNGDKNRTKLKIMRLERRDYISAVITIIYVACIFSLFYFG